MKTLAPNLAMLLLLSLSSCAWHRAGSVAAADPNAADAATVHADPTAASGGLGIAGDSSQIINTYMYRLTVPYGTANRNAAFWKLIDEDAVDLPTYTLLFDNGLRVGRGRVADWPMFQKVIGRHLSACAVTTFTGISGVGAVPLQMTPMVSEEMLFVLDQHGATGRIYSNSDNELQFSFAWAPRKPSGTVRIHVCPIIVGQRPLFDLGRDDEPADAAAIQPQSLYDLGLIADILPGEFLIIGLSTSADDPSRIGSRFLTHNGRLQRFEDFLMLSGSPIPVQGDVTTQLPATRPSSTASPLH